jgi:hypothetical protein
VGSLHRLFILTAAIAVAIAAVVAGQQASSPTSVATTEHFVLHSDPWINLHHFLYQWTRQDAGLSGGRKPVPVPERSSLAEMTDATRTDWLRAIAFYRAAVAPKSHWDLEMLRLKRDLLTLSGDVKAATPDRIKGVAEALNVAMPIYRGKWWPQHDTANREWIENAASRLRRHEKRFVELTARVNGAAWPMDRWRVDASAYANGIAGYTTREGHVVVYSTDPGVQDLYALEIILHEIQHATAIEGSTPDTLARAFKAAGVEVPANLTHALIFATAGEFVRSIAAGEGRPRYEPYWIREGFETIDGWSHLVAPVNQHWLPIVRGETSRDEGLTALAESFRK